MGFQKFALRPNPDFIVQMTPRQEEDTHDNQDVNQTMHGDEHKEHKKHSGRKHYHRKTHHKKESKHINAVQPAVEADMGPTTNINVMKLQTQDGQALNSGSDKARKPPAVEVALATGDSLTMTNRDKPGVGGGFDDA